MTTVGHNRRSPVHYGPRLLRADPPCDEPKPYDLLELAPSTPVIGAEISGVDLRHMPDDVFGELHRALLEWKVLFVRDQPLTGPQHLALARRWGEVHPEPFYPDGSAAGVSRLARDRGAPAVENVWHTDQSYLPRPSFGTVLRAVELPPVGGDTLWADMAAAYDNLAPDVKERVDGLRAVHTWVTSWGLKMTSEELAEMSERVPPVEHPVVRTHPETGRRTLFVNEPYTERILGIDPSEAFELLDHLLAQARVPEYQVRFRWAPGSVAIWDNRATQHYAACDYYPERRVMERVMIASDDRPR